MKLAHTLAAIGRVMITAGVLILLFVVYQLWGTGVHTQRVQNDLEQDFQAQEEDYSATHPEPPPPNPRRRQVVPHAPERGGGIGRIEIPAIGANFIFLEGVGLDVLDGGPGHYEGTPLPGEPGNAGIAGHRTTYLAPFNRIDELGEGDRIIISYINGSQFTYRYLATRIVTPDRVDVLETKFDNRLTLTACNPKYSAAERIVVSARLLERPARERAPDAEDAGGPIQLDDTGSLDGQTHAKTPAILWGIAAASVWLAAWIVGRAWRRWPTYLLGLPIFLVVLYGFFENFSYLLPANY